MRFLGRLRRRMGIDAPRMAVRAQVPLHWRILVVAVLVATVVGLAWWGFEAGKLFAGYGGQAAETELLRLTERNGQLEKENVELREATTTAQRQQQIDQAAQADLARQAKSLQDENARLKEDLASMESLLTRQGRPGAVQLEGLRVERGAMPGEFRYRMLVLYAEKQGKGFQGRYDLLVNYTAGGRKAALTLPAAGAADGVAYTLDFKYYRRLDGVFRVPADATVQNVEVRIYENGSLQTRATLAAGVS